jgi:serine/threonine protein kinase/Tfp pilus assembly protein PilF
LIGVTLSHYRITAKLGAGGMGEVYLAEDTKLERKVALKVLPAELAGDPHRLKRLQREARALAALDHPNIVTVFSVEEDEGIHFLTMAHVEGEDLDGLIPEEGFSVEGLLELAIPLADALRAAHEHGIVHRDLKPGNIMIDREGRLRVLDFGLARLEMAAGSEDITQLATETMTRAGTVMGTYPYMSPEQAQGQVADARSDLFSLGVILYEMVTGQRPFTGETGVSLISSILKDTPTPISDVKAGLPEEMWAIIETCLEKDPNNRFTSAEELRERLEALRREVRAGRTGVASRPRRLVLLGALVVAMAVAGVSGWLVWTRQEPSSETALSQQAGPQIASLAVLPLRNLSADPEQEYFVDGMTEALITDLSKIGALTVISRSSVMRYKGSEAPLSEIATERILWGDRYTRDLTSILGLQAQVAKAIAGSVRVALSPEEEARLSTSREVDPAAYDAVLKGLFYLQQFTPRGFDAALEYFETALEIAPDYAPAYAGMARVWSYRNQWSLVNPSEVAPLRRELIDRALELDDLLADAHLAEANFRVWYEFDWKGGEEAFLRAIELNPNHAEARIFYAHLLTILGRVAEGTAQAERALELDPLNPFFRGLAAVQLSATERSDEAIAMARSVLEIDPNHGLARAALGNVYRRQGRLEEALALLKEAVSARGDTELLEVLERGWVEGGYKGAMGLVVELLERRSKSGHVGNWGLALGFDYAGYPGKAIPYLEKAYEARAPNLPYVGMYPVSAEMRSNPRFLALLEKMDLPVVGSAGKSGD